MKRMISNIICWFVPLRKWRRAIRKCFRKRCYDIVGTGNKIIVAGMEYKGLIDGLSMVICGNNNLIRFAGRSTSSGPFWGGNPARVVKRNVRWHHLGPGLYEKNLKSKRIET